jgi:formate dehydrogenase maturation protein FdhE
MKKYLNNEKCWHIHDNSKYIQGTVIVYNQKELAEKEAKEKNEANVSNNYIKCPICGNNSVLSYVGNSVYRSCCRYEGCRKIVKVTAENLETAKKYFKKLGTNDKRTIDIYKLEQ